jgi:hypothetical protein
LIGPIHFRRGVNRAVEDMKQRSVLEKIEIDSYIYLMLLALGPTALNSHRELLFLPPEFHSRLFNVTEDIGRFCKRLFDRFAGRIRLSGSPREFLTLETSATCQNAGLWQIWN